MEGLLSTGPTPSSLWAIHMLIFSSSHNYTWAQQKKRSWRREGRPTFLIDGLILYYSDQKIEGFMLKNKIGQPNYYYLILKHKLPLPAPFNISPNLLRLEEFDIFSWASLSAPSWKMKPYKFVNTSLVFSPTSLIHRGFFYSYDQ